DTESKPLSQAVFEYSTIGVVRASVLQDDGTSHLVLQGLQRIRFVDWIDEKEYPYATIETIEPELFDRSKGDQLRKASLLLLDKLTEGNKGISKTLVAALVDITDIDVFADMFAQNVITNPYTRQHFLECINPCERLELLIRHLTNLVRQERSS
ncbi:MAG: LON peptidase substrate-binding domain-containing protein, partial [Verrucomicrobiota bacterium]